MELYVIIIKRTVTHKQIISTGGGEAPTTPLPTAPGTSSSLLSQHHTTAGSGVPLSTASRWSNGTSDLTQARRITNYNSS